MRLNFYGDTHTVALYFNLPGSGPMESRAGRCSPADRSPTVESVQ